MPQAMDWGQWASVCCKVGPIFHSPLCCFCPFLPFFSLFLAFLVLDTSPQETTRPLTVPLGVHCSLLEGRPKDTKRGTKRAPLWELQPQTAKLWARNFDLVRLATHCDQCTSTELTLKLESVQLELIVRWGQLRPTALVQIPRDFPFFLPLPVGCFGLAHELSASARCGVRLPRTADCLRVAGEQRVQAEDSSWSFLGFGPRERSEFGALPVQSFQPKFQRQSLARYLGCSCPLRRPFLPFCLAPRLIPRVWALFCGSLFCFGLPIWVRVWLGLKSERKSHTTNGRETDGRALVRWVALSWRSTRHRFEHTHREDEQ